MPLFPPTKLAKVNSTISGIPNYASASTSRLQSLYSDLSRQRASNPAAFQSNVDWWRRTLEQLVQEGKQVDSKDRLVLNAEPALAERLRVGGVGKPLGLAAVITELRHARALIPLDEFLKSTRPINDPGSLPYRIASYVVTKPLWWALEQMSLVDSSDGIGSESETSLWRKVQGAHVVMRNVESAADSVVAYLDKQAGVSLASSLYTYESFAKEVCCEAVEMEITEMDVKVLVRFLERDRKVLVTDKDVIKVLNPHSLDASHMVTVVDKGVLELKTAIASLEAQIEELQKRVAYRSEKTTEHIRTKQQDLAMTHLRARKQHEAQMKKRLGSLEILQDTLIRVENAAQDIQIMKQYESSTATLRMLLSHPSLQREKVDETLEALAEVNAEQRELDETIRMGVDVALDVGATVDEGDVAAELEGLVRDATREEEEKEERARLERAKEQLPAVPTGVADLEQELGKLKLGEPSTHDEASQRQALPEPVS